MNRNKQLSWNNTLEEMKMLCSELIKTTLPWILSAEKVNKNEKKVKKDPMQQSSQRVFNCNEVH